MNTTISLYTLQKNIVKDFLLDRHWGREFAVVYGSKPEKVFNRNYSILKEIYDSTKD